MPPSGRLCRSRDVAHIEYGALDKGRMLYRVYDGKWGYDEFNAGWGDTRFAPIDDPITGKRLSNMHLGESPTGCCSSRSFTTCTSWAA